VLVAGFVVPLSMTSPASAQRAHVVAGNLVLSGAWTTSANVAWVWTQSASGATGSHQAILRTADGGKSWANVTPGGLGVIRGDAYMGSVDVLNNSDAWIVHGGVSSHAQTLEFTTNAGRTWASMGTLPSGCTVQFVSRAQGWCTQYNGAAGSMGVKIFHTRDGGWTWQLLSRSYVNTDPKGTLPFACDKRLYFDNAERGWAIFDCNGGIAPIYETLDGGTTWVQRVNVYSGEVNAGSSFVGAPVTSGPHVAVGFATFAPTRSLVYVSNDGGRNFTPVQAPFRGRQIVQDLITTTSWKFMWGHTIYETDNAGTTWHSLTSNLDITSLTWSLNFVNARVGWLTGSTLWRTLDGGVTWTRLQIPTLPK
jgi:photosystem II stability/assembly factor-like uncharacterized protein